MSDEKKIKRAAVTEDSNVRGVGLDVGTCFLVGAKQISDTFLGHDQIGGRVIQIGRHLHVDTGQEAVEQNDQHHSQGHPPDTESQSKFLLKQITISQVSHTVSRKYQFICLQVCGVIIQLWVR